MQKSSNHSLQDTADSLDNGGSYEGFRFSGLRSETDGSCMDKGILFGLYIES
jgi:hypothetical protein